MGTRLVLGIGNPEPDYAGTRHNIGFDVVRRVAGRLEADVEAQRFRALYGTAVFRGHQVVLLMPTVFVNNSGMTAKAAADYFGTAPDDLLVVSDDVSLASGLTRVRRRGSAGGHNGLKSVIGWCGTERFPRLKIGIGREGVSDLVAFVLGRYQGEERRMLEGAVARGADAVLAWIENGVDKTMNLFN